MKKSINKIIKYIIKEKKQIIFALFAFIIFILSKNEEVLLNGIPVAVATAAKAVAKTAGKAAVKGAAVGAAQGAVNKQEDESRLKSMTKGAIGGATSAAKKSVVNSAMPLIKGNGSKNVNPNQNKGVQNLNNPNINNAQLGDNSESSNNKKSDNSTNVEGKNDSAESNPTNSSSLEEDDADLKVVKKAAKVVLTPLLGFGCIGGLLLALIVAVPLLTVSFTDPLSTNLVQYQCLDDDTGLCALKDKFSSFLEKAKNLIVYQTFGKDEEVVMNKVKEVNKEILKKYQTSIDIPTLVSTIYVDSENLKTDYNPNGEEILDSRMRKRLDYLYQLGELQIEMNEVAFTCKSRNVAGKLVFYKETNYSIDPSILPEAPCNSATVGQTLRQAAFGLDLDRYYEKLKNDKSLLKAIYPDLNVDNESLINEQIEMIKLRRDLFLGLYSDEEIIQTGLGNVPMTLFYDSSVNLISPLKGSIGITSPYGQRTGLFAGMHKGIDLVSNDKTIYAAGDGIVTRANTETEGGNVIEITHIASNGSRYVTLYAHLSQFLVNRGTQVKSGDMIGVMGCTGTLCSGVHLHFQVMDYETKQTYNPANLITD